MTIRYYVQTVWTPKESKRVIGCYRCKVIGPSASGNSLWICLIDLHGQPKKWVDLDKIKDAPVEIYKAPPLSEGFKERVRSKIRSGLASKVKTWDHSI